MRGEAPGGGGHKQRKPRRGTPGGPEGAGPGGWAAQRLGGGAAQKVSQGWVCWLWRRGAVGEEICKTSFSQGAQKS